MINRRTIVTAALAGSAFPAIVGAQDKPEPSMPRPEPRAGVPTVAVLISERATIIDFCGPWEVFQDAGYPLYTVSETTDAIHATAGMEIVPKHNFATAPRPNLVVIGAQSTRSPATLAWMRQVHADGAILMSVCTGAFLLAATGLLDGKLATTHHEFYDKFAGRYPRVTLHKDVRFVDNGDLVSAGGLTSGIDLALHMISRFGGVKEAARVASYMEYQSPGWRTAEATTKPRTLGRAAA